MNCREGSQEEGREVSMAAAVCSGTCTQKTVAVDVFRWIPFHGSAAGIAKDREPNTPRGGSREGAGREYPEDAYRPSSYEGLKGVKLVRDEQRRDIIIMVR